MKELPTKFVGDLPIFVYFVAQNHAQMPDWQCGSAKFFTLSAIEKKAICRAVVLFWQSFIAAFHAFKRARRRTGFCYS